MEDVDVGALLAAASAGDRVAWATLVDRYSGLLWSVARSYRLAEQDAADVLQTAWMRLLEHLDRIEDPQRLGAWLATVARHEIHRMHRRSVRTVPTADEVALDAAAGPAPGPDLPALSADRDRLLWDAFAEISARCQDLLRLVVTGTPERDALSYRDAATTLGVPIGSLGPTRMRCLTELRAAVRKRGISGEPDDS